MIEAGSIVSVGFFGVDDSDRDGPTVMESATMGSLLAGVTIGGEGIGAKSWVLIFVVEGRGIA